MPQELPLSDKAVELMAYLTMNGGASESQITQAVWPGEPAERARELLAAAVAEVNRAASDATGNPRPAIPGPDDESGGDGGPGPRLLVRVLGRPRVEVYQDDEPFPGQR